MHCDLCVTRIKDAVSTGPLTFAHLISPPGQVVAARKRSGEKVMFLLMFVCLQGGLPSHNVMRQADLPPPPL